MFLRTSKSSVLFNRPNHVVRTSSPDGERYETLRSLVVDLRSIVYRRSLTLVKNPHTSWHGFIILPFKVTSTSDDASGSQPPCLRNRFMPPERRRASAGHLHLKIMITPCLS